MAFFWKFTRSGKFSPSYVSLVLDANSQFVDKDKMLWKTSVEELEMVMVLLHDVEVHNQPQLGATKPAFKVVVEAIGYEPTRNYMPLRDALGLVAGQSVMGRHGGGDLDWGYYSNMNTPLNLDISTLQVRGFIDAKTGILFGTEDKLSCFRGHNCFRNEGFYYDLMPKHDVMIPIMKVISDVNSARANQFAIDSLKWVKHSAVLHR